jgi:hypothetical protein
MQNQQAFRTQTLGHFLFGTARVDDISPDGSLQHTADFQTCFLKRSGFHVVSAS